MHSHIEEDFTIHMQMNHIRVLCSPQPQIAQHVMDRGILLNGMFMVATQYFEQNLHA